MFLDFKNINTLSICFKIMKKASKLKNFFLNYFKYHFSNKWAWIIPFTLAGTACVGLGTSIYFVDQENQTQKNKDFVDPIQKKLLYLQSSGLVSPLIFTTSASTVDDEYNLSGYFGKDLSEIGLKVLSSLDHSVYYQENLPYTGIVAMNAPDIKLVKGEQTIVANAYDYVNLKYVRYSKKTRTIEDVKYAPPPGLFEDNTWPTLKPSDNYLTKFFPTTSIRNVIKKTLNLENNFSKTQWFNALNQAAMNLDLSNMALNSIAELFNPNLRWGFGIYDFVATMNQGWDSNNNTILYRGINSILVTNNNLVYFPNPQFKNFPALKSILARNNQIKAIGNFNTFSNSAPITEYKTDTELQTPTDTPTAVNYYEYLKGLWAETSDVKDVVEVQTIKKWLTITLPSKDYKKNQSTKKSGKKNITDYNSFLEAISGDNFYFKNDKGEVYINQKNSNITNNNANNKVADASTKIIPFDPNSQVITNKDGILEIVANSSITTTFTNGINFGGVKFAVSKDINTIDFSNNQIQRIPLSKNLFTNVNFANNKLKYVSPIALQPLPWFYPVNFVRGAALSLNNARNKSYYTDSAINLQPNNWNSYYNPSKVDGENNGQPSSFPASSTSYSGFSIGDANLIPPQLNFSGNQLLDFWPQQNQSASWYTWPRFAAPSSDKTPQPFSPPNSVSGYPMVPYNNQIGDSVEFYPWFHRTWIGVVSRTPISTYIGVFGPSLSYKANNNPNLGEDFTSGVNLYSYFFKQLQDNKELSYLQNFSQTFNYDLSRDKPFVLPGFHTNENKIKGISDFTDINPLDKNTDAYQSYNSSVPYLFSRTLPQNFNPIFSWGRSNGISGPPQKINVTITDANNGEDLTPTNFKNIDWVSFYTNANGLRYNTEKNNFQSGTITTNYKPSKSNSSLFTTDANNGNDVLTKIVGQLPYLQGRENAIGWNGSAKNNNNQALGLEQTTFSPSGKTANAVLLTFSAPLQLWQYQYRINLLPNLNYNITQKNFISEKDRTENIAASLFSKKNYFSNEITARDLALELNTWTVTSQYVQNYVSNNLDTALKIKSFDVKTGSLVVGFQLFDINNQAIETKDITITGFSTQKTTFFNDDTAIDSLDQAAAGSWVPDTQEKAIAWIQKRVGVRWIGLNLLTPESVTTVVTTTNPINSTSSLLSSERSEKLKTLNANGIFLLDQLQNPQQYINNVLIDKTNGKLLFTLIINGTTANGNIALVQNIDVTAFNKFDFSVDTSSVTNRSSSIYDIYNPLTKPNNFDNLKKYVTLKKTTTIFSKVSVPKSSTSETNTNWDKTKSSSDLIADKILSPGTALQISVNNVAPEQGIINFQVAWNSVTETTTPIKIVQGNINNQLIFNSTFDWKQNNNNLSKIAVISYETYKNQKPSEFKKALNEDVIANSEEISDKAKKDKAQQDFNQKIIPLVDLSKTAPKTVDGIKSNTEAEKLTDEEVKKLVFGFDESVVLTPTLLNENVIVDDVSFLTTIKNLAVKGGYKNGKFFAGEESAAPVYRFNEIRVAFNYHTTQNLAIKDTKISDTDAIISSDVKSKSAWEIQAQKLFVSALTRWKKLLPSEWVNQLQGLKIRQNTINPPPVNYNSFDNLTGFLNHVLTTSTSNSGYQTYVDIISDLNKILVNDTTGEITIPANTLLISNSYDDPKAAVRTLTAKPYDKEIKFTLSNYFSRFGADKLAQFPFDALNQINLRFKTQSVKNIISSLTDALKKAKILYASSATNPITAQQRQDAENAINALKFYFFSPDYYASSQIIQYLTTPFTINIVADNSKVGKYIEFDNITFSDSNEIQGSIKISVSVKNYVDNYTTKGFSIADKKTEFNITNVLGLRLQPGWNNFKPYDTEINSTNPKLKLINGKPVFGIINHNSFKTQSAAAYYAKLLESPVNSTLGPDYVMLDAKTPVLSTSTTSTKTLGGWNLVNTQGTSVNSDEVDQTTLTTMVNSASAQFVVKKSDIYLDNDFNQIFIMNPFIHFGDRSKGLNALKNSIFDSRTFNNDLITTNGNYFNLALSNVVLEGFAPKPIQVKELNYNQTNYQLDFTDFQVLAKDILPSTIFEWLSANYFDNVKISRFLNSFFRITGYSSIINPLSLVLNPDLTKAFANKVSAVNLNQFITLNDGTGQFDFLPNSIQIANAYHGNDINNISVKPIDLVVFLANQPKNLVGLHKLKFTNSAVLFAGNPITTVNLQDLTGINNNIRQATEQLSANNYSLTYRYLQLKQILVTTNSNHQKLVVNAIVPNLINGTIAINYEIQGGYKNGNVQTFSNKLVLTGFHSNTSSFLKNHLPWILTLSLVSAIGLFVFVKYYAKFKTTIKNTYSKRESVISKNKKNDERA